MVSITITLDKQTRADMQKFPWVNWSEIARQILIQRLQQQRELEKVNRLLQKNTLTDQDIQQWSSEVRKGRFKELKKQGLV